MTWTPYVGMLVQLNQKARSESRGKDFPLVVLAQINSTLLHVAFEVPPRDPDNGWYSIQPTGLYPYAFHCLKQWLEPWEGPRVVWAYAEHEEVWWIG